MRPGLVRPAAICAAATLVLAGCGGADATGACLPEERIIEPSAIHVIGDTEVTYASSPPTSGPHQIPAPELGVSAVAVSEPLQVGALETGAVLIQYQAEVPAADVAALEALADADGVLVAPAIRPFDEEAAVAFSAWGLRQLCERADVDAAAAFVERNVGVFFVDHP